MNLRRIRLTVGRASALALRIAMIALCLSCTVTARTALAADQLPNPSEPPASSDDARKEPVVLLTGFEPFGPGRPKNPSWEGIRQLDGRIWRGHRLVAREMKVLWGSPLSQLSAWVDEFHPIAILSFGQGGGFTIESRASNSRGRGKDNNEQLPPTPTVVDGGPDNVSASTDCAALSKALATKGFPIRVSTNAGRYLCEETLYTLEHLRATKAPSMRVQFCHVPSLGDRASRRDVDAAYIQEFVEAVLEASLLTPQPSQSLGAEATADARVSEITALVNHYFSTWSAQEMEKYGQCFAEGAVIQQIDSGLNIESLNLDKFLASQRQAHRQSRFPMRETPVDVKVSLEAGLGRAVVYWKLVAGSRVEYGYDHFTVMKRGGAWKIINLVYYSVDRAE